MKTRIVNLLTAVLPLFVLRFFLPRRFVIYGHLVSDRVHPVRRFYKYPSTGDFQMMLDYFERQGYKYVGLTEYVSNKFDKMILLTFDDGFKVIVEELHPLMRKRGIPYMLFVLTAPLQNQLFQIKTIPAEGNERMFLDEEEIMALRADQVHIGYHTNTHLKIEASANEEDIREEIIIPSRYMRLFSTPLAFAYPYLAPPNYRKFNQFMSAGSGINYFFDTQGFGKDDGNHFFRVSIDGELQLTMRNWLMFVIKRQLLLFVVQKFKSAWR